jgi:kynurenine formamidase
MQDYSTMRLAEELSMSTVSLTNSDLIGLVSELSNWGRWGSDDQLGTLNHIDVECRRHAASLVSEGVVTSCAWQLGGHGFHTPGTAPQRFMIRSGEGLFDEHSVPPIQPELGGRARLAAEYIGLRFHGLEITHIDALSHAFWDGQAYNGVPAARVSSESGATELDVTRATSIVTRGVLLDVAAQRGVEYLEPGTRVLPSDLEAAEERQGVRVGKGDAVLLRTGNGRRCEELGFPAAAQADARSGWHASCLRWLHERDVAVIGNDGTNDPAPFEFPEMPLPVHTIGIVGMGLWLIDNCNLEELAKACERFSRYEFLFTIAPLLLVGATGSPVNPLATF